MAEPRRIRFHWHLRRVVAAHNLWKSTELRPLLRSHHQYGGELEVAVAEARDLTEGVDKSFNNLTAQMGSGK